MLAVVLFFVFFPKQLAAREAERRIEAATHRQLTLGDDINVTFFPALGFSVNAVSLSNPRALRATQPFLTADRVVFAVAVMPLLRGDIQVRELTFQGAHVNLRAKQMASRIGPSRPKTIRAIETTLEDLRLDDVRLIDSAISFQGADGQPPLQLAHVDAQLALQVVRSAGAHERRARLSWAAAQHRRHHHQAARGDRAWRDAASMSACARRF